MKKNTLLIYILLLFVISFKGIAEVVSIPFPPEQSQTFYPGKTEAENTAALTSIDKQNRGRLRLSVAVSDTRVQKPINLGKVVFCSSTKCFQPETPDHFSPVTTQNGQASFLADTLLSYNQTITDIYFEKPPTADNYVQGHIKLASPITLAPITPSSKTFNSYQMFVTLRAEPNDKAYYKPWMETNIPSIESSEFELVFYDPIFSLVYEARLGATINVPANALQKPLVFFVRIFDNGEKFPLVDFFTYPENLELDQEMTLDVSEIAREAKILNYAIFKDGKAITKQPKSGGGFAIFKTNKFGNFDTYDFEHKRKLEPTSNNKSTNKINTLAATLSCSSLLTKNMNSYTTILNKNGFVRINECETIPPYIHMMLIDLSNTKIKFNIPVNVKSTAKIPHTLGLRPITDYKNAAIVGINGFTWDGDWGFKTPAEQQGTAKGFLNTNNIVRANNKDVKPQVRKNKIILGLTSAEKAKFFETEISTTDFGSYKYNVVSSSTSIVKNNTCTTEPEENRWSGLGAEISKMLMVSTVGNQKTTAVELCSVFKAFGIKNALRMDGGPSAAMVMNGIHLNPLESFIDTARYGSVRKIAYPILIGN